MECSNFFRNNWLYSEDSGLQRLSLELVSESVTGTGILPALTAIAD